MSPETGQCHECGATVAFNEYGYGVCVQKEQHVTGRETIVIGPHHAEAWRTVRRKRNDLTWRNYSYRQRRSRVK